MITMMTFTWTAEVSFLSFVVEKVHSITKDSSQLQKFSYIFFGFVKTFP